MRKFKIITTLVIALAIVFLSVPTAKASGPTGGWASGISCQNLDTVNSANGVLTFYRQGESTKAIEYPLDIAPGSSTNWLTTSSINMPGFPSGFLGSAVVSSSTQLACNVNTQSTGVGTSSSPYRIGASSGFNESQTGVNVYIPQAVRNVSGWNSYLAVQNTLASSVTVKVNYFNGDGTAVSGASDTATIPGNSSMVFYQNETPNLPDGFNGGAVVSAQDGTTKLAVTVAVYQDGSSYSKAQFLAYNGFTKGATKLFVPRFVRKLVGNNGGFAIQNVGGSDTNVTITFTFGTKTYVATKLVKKNASWVGYATMAELNGVDAQPTSEHQGSAIIQADPGGLIVANINEDNRDPSQGTRYGQGSSYNAILDGDQTNTVFFAQFTKNAANIFSSGFQISNTTSTDGTCNITYSDQSAINETAVPLAKNGVISRFGGSVVQPAMVNMKNGYNAAVSVTCTVPVTGIVNLAAYGGKYGDSFTQTGGLNQ